MAGGRVWPLAQLRGVVEVAQEHGLRLHMDGARLMNAVVASGVPAAEFTRGFDTAWLDFTKGLGAPLGACLAGSAELIEEAWRYKQMLGGALRQAGIVAAGALYALDHHVDRLAEDHANARALALRARGAAASRSIPTRWRRTSSSSRSTIPKACAPRWSATASVWERSVRGGCAPSRTWTSTRTGYNVPLHALEWADA